jgi:hypothetical protein
MAEPIQTTVAGVSLVTLAVAFFGPQAGPYIVIILGSIGGGLWALSSAALDTRMAGAWLMLRCVVTAVVLTAVISVGIGRALDIPVSEAYAVVAFVIGALGNRWQDIMDSIKMRIQGAIANSGPRP